tara:strand:+ start:173 stop:901 length:729 start_codon:yes stop_codon:yes gene_type:complete
MKNPKLTNRQLYPPKIMDMMFSYVMGETEEYNKLTKNNTDLKIMIESTCNLKTIGADVREVLSARILGWEHNPSINGYDAVRPDGRDGELKNESLRGDGLYHDNIDEWVDQRIEKTGKKPTYKLNGRTRWSKCTDSKSSVPGYKHKLERLQTENPRMGIIGWVGPFAAYAVTFDFNEGKGFSRKLKMKSPTTSTEDWESASSLKLRYINPDFHSKKYMETGLYNALKNLIQKNINRSNDVKI